jgi:hypothetical protein
MEKFDGANFHLWKFKMRMMLYKHGLWKFVDGSATLPSEEVASVDYNEKEMKAFALLCEHLMDAQLAHIQYCDNLKSAWEAFCGLHEAKTMSNKLFLRRRFFTIKMQEGDDMLLHINTMKALADQLRSIEVNITDEDVYMVLFMSLPPSFDNLVTSLESMCTKYVDLQFIVARLLHEMSKRKECESSETIALLNKTHKSNEKLCFYCKKPRHFVRNCLKKKNDEKEKANQACEDHEQMFVATLSANDHTTYDWIVDWGATQHMTFEQEWFITYEHISPRKVFMGDNIVLEAIGKGNIKATMQVGSELSHATITQVLHVPKMKNNFISVSKLISKGFKVEFEKDGCKVNDARGVVVAEARRDKNLYLLNVKVRKDMAHIANSLDEGAMLWHERLGHLNMEGLKEWDIGNNLKTSKK